MHNKLPAASKVQEESCMYFEVITFNLFKKSAYKFTVYYVLYS